MPKELSDKQRSFADHLATGMSKADAYRKAYDVESEGRWVSIEACKVSKIPVVAEYIAKIRDDAQTDKTATRTEKRELLREAMFDQSLSWSERIKAIEADNKMAGHNEPEQVNINVYSQILAIVRNEDKPLLARG